MAGPRTGPNRCEPTSDWRCPVPTAHVNQDLNVEIDVVVQRSALTERIREQSPGSQLIPPHAWRITAKQLGGLIDALLAALASSDIRGPLADLAGIDPIAVPQPRVMHLVTARPITDVLDTAGLRLIPNAGTSKGAHLLADPARDLADEGDRRDQVTAWLTQIALDAGLWGMEQHLRRLALSQTDA